MGLNFSAVSKELNATSVYYFYMIMFGPIYTCDRCLNCCHLSLSFENIINKLGMAVIPFHYGIM